MSTLHFSSKSISTEVGNVLRNATITGNQLVLNGSLDRSLYTQTTKVLEALGGKWSKRQQAHVFSEPVAPLLSSVLNEGKIPDANPYSYYPTPFSVGVDLLDRAELTYNPSLRVLEPSGGEGHLIDAIRQVIAPSRIDTYEIAAENRKFLAFHCDIRVCGEDFLNAPIEPYDAVIMNPPFTTPGDSLAWLTHTEHAVKYVKPGGVLAAILPNSIVSTKNKRTSNLLKLFGEDCAITPHDEGAFKSSGTLIHTVSLIWWRAK